MQNLPKNRRGDHQPGNRADEERYFDIDGQWYFTTREGITMGPYDSQVQAMEETKSYINFINKAKTPVLKVLKRGKSTVDLEYTEAAISESEGCEIERSTV